MKNWKNVLIVFLILLILGLSGYILYDKIISNSSKTYESDSTENSTKSNAQIALELSEKLDNYYVDYYDNLSSTKFDSMSEGDLLVGAYVYIINKYGEDNFKKQYVDEYFEDLFGMDLENYPDLMCVAGDGALYKYNAELGEYQKDCGNSDICHAHGGTLGHPKSITMKYTDISKDGDLYIITMSKVFGSNLKDSDGYFYYDYNYKTRIKGLDSFTDGTRELNSDELLSLKDYYEQNFDRFKQVGPKYRYTFKEVDGNYYLISFKTMR